MAANATPASEVNGVWLPSVGVSYLVPAARRRACAELLFHLERKAWRETNELLCIPAVASWQPVVCLGCWVAPEGTADSRSGVSELGKTAMAMAKTTCLVFRGRNGRKAAATPGRVLPQESASARWVEKCHRIAALAADSRLCFLFPVLRLLFLYFAYERSVTQSRPWRMNHVSTSSALGVWRVLDLGPNELGVDGARLSPFLALPCCRRRACRWHHWRKSRALALPSSINLRRLREPREESVSPRNGRGRSRRPRPPRRQTSVVEQVRQLFLFLCMRVCSGKCTLPVGWDLACWQAFLGGVTRDGHPSLS